METRILKRRAKELRATQTDVEKLLWRALRNRQMAVAKFRRQHVIGCYIVDFVCLDKRLIIEVDGGQHADQQHYDLARDNFLRDRGYTVLRFWNNEVLNEFEAVLDKIHKALIICPSPQPSPLGGEREMDSDS